MARADVASASLRSDSIKGLAESIANPAYRRLLSAEPLLRRAVPVLIVAFMVTVCIGAAVQVLEHRRQAVFEAKQSVAALADHFAAVFERRSATGARPGRAPPTPWRRHCPIGPRAARGAYWWRMLTAISSRACRTLRQSWDGRFSMCSDRYNRSRPSPPMPEPGRSRSATTRPLTPPFAR